MKTLNLKEHGEKEGSYDELVIWNLRIWKLVSVYMPEIGKILTTVVEDTKGERLVVSFVIPLKGYYEKYDLLEKEWNTTCFILAN